MARISKADAAEVAGKLVQKIHKEVKIQEKELKEYITEIYVATLPVDVKRMWSRGKKWMRNTNYVRLNGTGLTNNYKLYYLTESYPADTNGYTYIDLTDEQAGEVVKYNNKIHDLEVRAKDTKIEIENLLLSIGTWKKALAELPEIRPYVPQQENKKVMVVPEKTREKINCLISTTDTKCIEVI